MVETGDGVIRATVARGTSVTTPLASPMRTTSPAVRTTPVSVRGRGRASSFVLTRTASGTGPPGDVSRSSTGTGAFGFARTVNATADPSFAPAGVVSLSGADDSNVTVASSGGQS